ncbi:hypothetical protein M408DRAFT_27405 [Serendipita vermifera MAFF 305830]|uniref:DUF4246 domain-containing protein n=1 Tax=Serendipita vermifera MAFF 305830 TaxID=933852 RepID=A0A0C2WBY0_SERVB|nr:hypothetical protein M408DRAFT_27405 [Serendipita vermifera MAFF 305830]
MSHLLPMGDKGYLHPFLDGRLYDTGVGEDIRTLVELKMDRLSYYIRSLPSWWTHLEDPKVLREWREIARDQQFITNENWNEDTPLLQTIPGLTEYQITWVLNELRWYARRRDPNDCQVSCFERVWESDSALPDEIRRGICAQIDACFLTNDTTRRECLRRDWVGPQARNVTILDFVHPFDFPIVSNRTLRFEDDGGERRLVNAVIGTKYGAIPTDFVIPTEDQPPVVSRLGYISGIPPTKRFTPLLDLINAALEKSIPLFERTLTSLHRANHVLVTPRIALGTGPPIRYERGTDPPDEPGQGIGDGTDDEEDEEQWHEWDRAVHRWAQTRKPIPPDLPTGGYVERPGLDGETEHKVSLRGRTLQLFIKLSRVELTPNSPRFPGGEWTCEGSYENRVVACMSTVLDSSNVTDGELGLKMAVTRPIITASDPDFACMEYWGKKRYYPLNQFIGAVRMKEGRCIAYPNLYQHRLSPFELVDPTKPGHRTILQLQLVDPELAVLSTTDVPPQPASWALDALLESLDKRLPMEVVLKIMEFAVGEEFFLSDDCRWPYRYEMQLLNELDRERIGCYFEEEL